ICAWDGCGMDLQDDACAPSAIRQHLKDHHFCGNTPSSKDRIACKWGGNCNREPMQWENISKHIAEYHLKSMARTCPYCGRSFARSDTLQRHLRSGG
ncbi:hypothetical protein BV20DRAFT_906128, partial [Pilatotrama ljubarskyi]